MKSNKSIIDDYCALTLALTPILGIYLVASGISLALALQVIAIVLSVPKLKKNIHAATPEMVFFMAVLIISFLGYLINIGTNWYNKTLFWHNLFSVCVSFVFIICVLPGLNCRKLLQYTFLIGVIVSLLTIYQRFQLFRTGSFSHFYIFPNLVQTVELELDYLRRPTSLFSEPSHISIYLLPLFYLAVYFKKYYYSALFVLGILFSGSTLGLVGLGLVVILFIFSGQRNNKSKFLLISVFGILLFLVYRVAPSVFIDSIDKIESTDSSTSIRLLGSISMLQNMSGFELFAGIGLNQMESFTHGNFSNYSNSILYSIISYGYLGLVALLLYFYKRFKVFFFLNQ